MGGWNHGNGGAPTWQWYATGALGVVGILIVALWATHGTAIDELKVQQKAELHSRSSLESRLTRIEVITERMALDVAELRRLAEAREDRRRDRPDEQHP